MFTSGYREATDTTIAIGDVRHEIFLCVLHFLYTGKPREIDPEMALEVMGVANLYAIEPLKRLCAELLTRTVSVQNAATVLDAADKFQITPLRQHCINFMVEHFAEVVRTDAFRELLCVESRPLVLQFLEEAAERMPASAAGGGGGGGHRGGVLGGDQPSAPRGGDREW